MASKNEDIRTDVKMKLTEALYFTCGSILTRFPYVWAILLMMTTAEYFKTALSVDGNKLSMSYANLGGYFLAATAMSFNLFGTKRLFALITVGQFIVLSIQGYLDENGKEAILVRQISRNIAIMGCFLMVAGGLTEFQRGAQKHKRLLQTGLQFIGIYSFINAVLVWNSPIEFKAYVTHLPGGIVTTYLFIALYLAAGMCIYGGYETFYFSKALAWLMFIVTLFVDMDSKFWWNTSHISYWVEMTIVSHNFCVITTLLLIRYKI